jgi:hypothetical protein
MAGYNFRQKSSGAEGERLKEAASINKSLSTLGSVRMIRFKFELHLQLLFKISKFKFRILNY